MEYYAMHNNVYYLIDKDRDEAIQFNGIGQAEGAVSATTALMLSKLRTEVDILSILGETTSSVCDVYFQNMHGICQMDCMSAYQSITHEVKKVNLTAFRIRRSEGIGLMQLLIPVKKNTCTREYISNILHINNWRNV